MPSSSPAARLTARPRTRRHSSSSTSRRTAREHARQPVGLEHRGQAVMIPVEGMEIVGITDVGRTRTRNEDAIDWDAAIGLAVLADGLGGHNAGDVASTLAVANIKTAL